MFVCESERERESEGRKKEAGKSHVCRDRYNACPLRSSSTVPLIRMTLDDGVSCAFIHSHKTTTFSFTFSLLLPLLLEITHMFIFTHKGRDLNEAVRDQFPTVDPFVTKTEVGFSFMFF
jgi:hypothetical protein